MACVLQGEKGRKNGWGRGWRDAQRSFLEIFVDNVPPARCPNALWGGEKGGKGGRGGGGGAQHSIPRTRYLLANSYDQSIFVVVKKGERGMQPLAQACLIQMLLRYPLTARLQGLSLDVTVLKSDSQAKHHSNITTGGTQCMSTVN